VRFSLTKHFVIIFSFLAHFLLFTGVLLPSLGFAVTRRCGGRLGWN